MPSQDVLLAFQTSLDGLGVGEEEARLAKYGPNQLRADKGTPLGKIFVRQVANPLVFVLGFAVILSMTLGRYTEGLLTLAVMLMNAMLGFIQEYRAEKSLQALKKFLPAEVTLRRAGRTVTVLAEQVVPGDILLLANGAQVPADARLLVAKGASTNEAALTGESAEVIKQIQPISADALLTERTNMIFAGSTVVSGRFEAVVVATGKATQFGQVSEMVANVPDTLTPLQEELARLARVLVWVMVAAAGAVFGVGLIRGLPFVDILSTSAALAVAAVPEGLLVSVTVILTVGMRRMLKRQALVRKLVAAETLGGVNVLCVDKTGTLTTGVMEVAELRYLRDLLALENLKPEGRKLLRDLRLAITARVEDSQVSEARIIGSVTEASLLRFLLKHQEAYSTVGCELVDELPFDSVNKYSASLIREAGAERLLVMGAPEKLVAWCDLTDREAQAYQATIEDMAKRGLRVLFLAGKPVAPNSHLAPESLRDLQPLGLIGLHDPLRPTVAQTLAQAVRAGVRVIMITGDHPVTASAIGTELGLSVSPDSLLLGSEIGALSETELLTRLRRVVICARILPEQKLQIVRGLQKLGATVAMTGDGVNDTPALRAADIGVAVGSGTEAAKESSDMVILDNDVRSIVAAIREGRIIFDNIRKVLTHLLTFSMSELGFIATVIVLGLPVPLWPLHILWINLVTDGLPSLALAFEPGEPRIMNEPPRARHTAILTVPMKQLMVFIGMLAVTSLLIIFIFFLNAGLPMATIRTLIFVSLGLDSLTAILPLRSLRRPFWRIKLFHNPELIGALVLGTCLLFLPILQPDLRKIFELSVLSGSEWGLIFVITLVKLGLIEAAKAWFLVDIRKENAGLI
jgi:Ca2+-transporting ATPase